MNTFGHMAGVGLGITDRVIREMGGRVDWERQEYEIPLN